MIVEYTMSSSNDLDELYEFLSQAAGIGTAANIIHKIEGKIDDLPLFPKQHKVWRNSGLRYFTVSNYMVLYLIDEPSDKIIIIKRIFYSHRDIDLLL